jgi:hypothetical protein
MLWKELPAGEIIAVDWVGEREYYYYRKNIKKPILEKCSANNFG